MSKPKVLFLVALRKALALLCIATSECTTVVPLAAQNDPGYTQSRAGKSTPGRAEQEAEQEVSLSADKIIEILRQEPGLLLQVKKRLVREAFAQGRLIDAKDLTDEAVFALLREEEGVRVLATQEIEDRAYVRAKPTREEIKREEQWMAQRGLRLATTQPAGAPPPEQPSTGQGQKNPGMAVSQEETYWQTHEQEWESPFVPPTLQAPPATQPYPQYPVAPEPQNPEPQNPARTVERSDLELELAPNGGTWENSPAAGGNFSPMNAPELPSLLDINTSSAGAFGAGPVMPGQTAGSLPGALEPGNPNQRPPDLQGSSNRTGQMQAPRGYSTQPAQFPLSARATYPPRLFPPMDLEQNRPAIRHRPNPYADVPSLYDLYEQVSRRPPLLERFGLEVFRANGTTLDQFPMDLPAGPDYVLGPGDGLSIELWGSVPQRLQRIVDSEGRVALPEVGSLEVTGRSLGEVQHLVQTALRSEFRNIQADVSLARIRTVRVYVVGDVVSPGAYDISSLSTPLNALYAAGGPTAQGSLRHLRHYRGQKLIDEVDAYQLLLRGVQNEPSRMQSGDTLLVPPLGPEVTVEGMVRRPAIYELGEEKSLAEVLELAGGVLPSGELRQVDVERVVAHEKRTMLRLELPESDANRIAKSDPQHAPPNDPPGDNPDARQQTQRSLGEFLMQDGDRVKISPILPYADQTVYLDGHVFRPGKYPYQEGMKVTDILHSYGDLLPEPSARHAEIIRLQGPEHTPVILAFNLGEAMQGRDQNLALQPFDTIRIFSRFDFEDPPLVTVTGEVRDPGDHITNGVTHLRDAIYLAGGLGTEAELDDAQVFRRSADNHLSVLSVNLAGALAGNAKDNIVLAPKDRVFVHRNLAKSDPPTVSIQGQVARPGKYPLGQEMNATDLVLLAGGLKRGAYVESADLTRYTVVNGKKVVGEHLDVAIASALAGQPDTNVRLRDGDVLTIGELAGWNDIGATIQVEGEVLHPGTYGISEGERLSSVLARAGGLRSNAYPYGAVFERLQVREMEEKNRSQLLEQIQKQGAELKTAPENDEDQRLAKQAAMAQWQTALERLQNTPPAGRLVIHISSDIKRWANTSADVQVRAGDVIYIPKKPNIVMVTGSVYNPTAVTYKPGKSAAWYLSQAGGPDNVANKKAIFIIRADGSAVGGPGGLFAGSAQSSALQPGDLVVVPEKAFSANTRWKTTLQAAQLTSAVGIAIQVARSF